MRALLVRLGAAAPQASPCHEQDLCNFWSLSSTVWDDLRFSWDEIREAGRSLGIIYNLGVYLQRFYPKKKIQVQKFERLEDLYILSRLESTRKECTDAFEEYRVHDAAKAVRRFIVEDLSRFYLKLAKKREDEEALAVAYECVLGALVLASPIIPYTCDAVYHEFFSRYEDAESIHLVSWKEPDEKRINKLLERRMHAADQIITAAINARQKGNVKLRWPLEEIIVSSNETEVKDTVSELCRIICEMANVRNVRAGKIENVRLSLELNFAKIGEKFREESKAVARDLEHANAEQVALAFAKDGKFILKEKYEITKEMALVTEEAEGYAIAEFEGGKVYLKTKMNKELMREAIGAYIFFPLSVYLSLSVESDGWSAIENLSSTLISFQQDFGASASVDLSDEANLNEQINSLREGHFLDRVAELFAGYSQVLSLFTMQNILMPILGAAITAVAVFQLANVLGGEILGMNVGII